MAAAAAASYTTIPGHQVQRAARRHVAQPHALKRRHAHRGAEGAPMHRLAKTVYCQEAPRPPPPAALALPSLPVLAQSTCRVLQRSDTQCFRTPLCARNVSKNAARLNLHRVHVALLFSSFFAAGQAGQVGLVPQAAARGRALRPRVPHAYRGGPPAPLPSRRLT